MGSGNIVIDRKCLCHHGSHILVRETDVEEFMTKSIIYWQSCKELQRRSTMCMRNLFYRNVKSQGRLAELWKIHEWKLIRSSKAGENGSGKVKPGGRNKAHVWGMKSRHCREWGGKGQQRAGEEHRLLLQGCGGLGNFWTFCMGTGKLSRMWSDQIWIFKSHSVCSRRKVWRQHGMCRKTN